MTGTTAVDVQSLPGTIHPFMMTNRSFLHVVSRELASVLTDPKAKKIMAYLMANLLCTVILLVWCSSTDSMALTAYTYLTIFDIMSLVTCLITVWVQKQKPSPIFSFGYERFEVLAVFSSTLLAQLGALFIVKESIERMIIQPDIHTGRLLVGAGLAFTIHLMVTYSMDNRALNHVMAASSSSWLQEHVSDMSQSLCHVVPGLSKLLLPRINPLTLIAFAGGGALVFTYVLIDVNNYHSIDTWSAIWIVMMTCGTMFPMSIYSGKILLQTTPSHIIGQLDKCLREASTLDGVLEFRHEHFWTLAFGTLGGSVHVRIRRDADEQLVLAHVFNRLSNLVSLLTIQVFKDDWSRPTAYQIIGESSIPSHQLPGGTAAGGGNINMNHHSNSSTSVLQQKSGVGVEKMPSSVNNSFSSGAAGGVRVQPIGANNANFVSPYMMMKMEQSHNLPPLSSPPGGVSTPGGGGDGASPWLPPKTAMYNINSAASPLSTSFVSDKPVGGATTTSTGVVGLGSNSLSSFGSGGSTSSTFRPSADGLSTRTVAVDNFNNIVDKYH